MNKKSLLGLILFACLVTIGLFVGTSFLIQQGNSTSTGLETADTEEKNIAEENSISKDSSEEDAEVTDLAIKENQAAVLAAGTEGTTERIEDLITEEPWLSANPSDTDMSANEKTVVGSTSQTGKSAEGSSEIDNSNDGPGDIVLSNLSEDELSTAVSSVAGPQLILNSEEVDYQSYIPDMVCDSALADALDISNPSIDVDAKAAILFDANTKEVLYYKNAVQAQFPASTVKLLTSIVALKWCKEEEEVTIGDEVKMIASDSTRAGLWEGEILTIRNLLEAMLLPSGNDAAYAVATYVGRKSLQNTEATREEAVAEFIHLMNVEAILLGAKNSCFQTPDGYDAVGQYTTAYDMGLIGVAAANNPIILEVTNLSSSRNIFVSGEDVTWCNTNKLITKYSGQYYSCAIGLKTGTSTMAGRCIIAAAEKEGKKVVCAILDSTSAGRWEDAIALLKYGLE